MRFVRESERYHFVADDALVHVDGLRFRRERTRCAPPEGAAACLDAETRPAAMRTAALRELLDPDAAAWDRVPATCSDGAAAAAPPNGGGGGGGYDVALHVRAITRDFERIDGAHEKAFAAFADAARPPPASAWRESTLYSPAAWERLAGYVARYVQKHQLRARVYIASNHAAVRDELAQRLRERGVGACFIDDARVAMHSSDARHTNFTDDAAVTDWLHLAEAARLILQLGLGCVLSVAAECHHANISSSWDSAFSKSAQIYGGGALRARLVNSGIIDFRKPGSTHGSEGVQGLSSPRCAPRQ